MRAALPLRAAGLREGAFFTGLACFFFATGLRATGFFVTAFFAAAFFFARFFFATGLRGSTFASAAAFAARRLRRSAIAAPSSAGDFTVRTPAASSALYLSAAVPLPPATTAPAWPMRLPGGAVTPVM